MPSITFKPFMLSVVVPIKDHQINARSFCEYHTRSRLSNIRLDWKVSSKTNTNLFVLCVSDEVTKQKKSFTKQGEVANSSTILQQTFVVEYVVNNQVSILKTIFICRRRWDKVSDPVMLWPSLKGSDRTH